MTSDGKFKHIKSDRIHKPGLFGLRLIYIPLIQELKDSKILSFEDKERLLEFKNEQKRRQFLSARIALNKIDQNFSQKISYHGMRPFLKDEINHISLSHSNSYAIAAWHPTLPVGIDIESDRDQLKKVSKKFLSINEINKIESSPNPKLARRIAWGAKESIFKAADQKSLSFSKDIQLKFIATKIEGKGVANISDGRQYVVYWSLIKDSRKNDHAIVCAVEKPKSLRIVLTGPESSGKTKLTNSLSKYFKMPFVPEYAREYLNKKNKEYNLSDLLKINDAQTKVQKATDGEMVFWDTDIITIIIWAKEKFGASNEIFEKLLKENIPHFYLLCNPDLKWEQDDLRENPNDRYRLLKEFQSILIKRRIPYAHIQGKGEIRLKNAIESIQSQIF
jgi:nicotinamide riboside kinase/4'-phosphopantetheinyl transferase EntD